MSSVGKPTKKKRGKRKKKKHKEAKAKKREIRLQLQEEKAAEKSLKRKAEGISDDEKPKKKKQKNTHPNGEESHDDANGDTIMDETVEKTEKKVYVEKTPEELAEIEAQNERKRERRRRLKVKRKFANEAEERRILAMERRQTKSDFPTVSRKMKGRGKPKHVTFDSDDESEEEEEQTNQEEAVKGEMLFDTNEDEENVVRDWLKGDSDSEGGEIVMKVKELHKGEAGYKVKQFQDRIGVDPRFQLDNKFKEAFEEDLDKQRKEREKRDKERELELQRQEEEGIWPEEVEEQEFQVERYDKSNASNYVPYREQEDEYEPRKKVQESIETEKPEPAKKGYTISTGWGSLLKDGGMEDLPLPDVVPDYAETIEDAVEPAKFQNAKIDTSDKMFLFSYIQEGKDTPCVVDSDFRSSMSGHNARRQWENTVSSYRWLLNHPVIPHYRYQQVAQMQEHLDNIEKTYV